MPDRTVQIASVIRHAVQSVLTRGLNDPRIRGLISVTKVEVLPNLAEAKVFVSVLPAEQAELTMHGLRAASRFVQGEVAKSVATKRMPHLSFKLDDSLKKQALVDAAISQSGVGETNLVGNNEVGIESPCGDEASGNNEEFQT